MGGIIIIETFKRREEKYLLTSNQYKQLLFKIENYIEKDKYFESNICNIYFDTDNFDLIKTSIEKPIYKEKVRLRSYQVPDINDKVFFEIKKKYKGITNKRRIVVTLKEFNDYYINHQIPKCNQQIFKEIDYIMKQYNLKPAIFLAYNRLSYFSKDNKDFRLTFDKNLRFRVLDLDLSMGDSGKKYFKDDMYILEIKTLDSIPLWFVKVLSELKIYPTSFSKYGSIYRNYLFKEALC